MNDKKGERRDFIDSVPDEILSATNQEEKEERRDCVDRVPDAARSSVDRDETDDEGDCVDGIPDMIFPAENDDEKEEGRDVVDAGLYIETNDVNSTVREQPSYVKQHQAHVNIQNASNGDNSTDSLVPSYKMDHPERGYFVIFNQQNFAVKNMKLNKRDGTMIDATNLEGMAKVLGFDKDKIIVHTDLTRKEVIACIEDYAKEDHREHDCFVCVVLTHGQRLAKDMPTSLAPKSITVSKELLFANDAVFELADLKRPFEGDKCLSLAGKPKLFFIQGCRGQTFDQGVIVPEAGHEENETQNPAHDALDGPGEGLDHAKPEEEKIPIEADFLFGHCTTPEYYAWRSTNTGSPYIQHLCKWFRKYGRTHDVEQILKLVNHNVAHDFVSNARKEKHNKKKQMPVFTSQLTKRLCFTGHTKAE